MNIQFAVDHIPRRLEELGYGDKEYYTRIRHLILQGKETLEIDSYNQLYFLVEEVRQVSINSELGIFDLNSKSANELQYEHQGQIIINNYAAGIRHVRLIQVIFKCKRTWKKMKKKTSLLACQEQK